MCKRVLLVVVLLIAACNGREVPLSSTAVATATPVAAGPSDTEADPPPPGRDRDRWEVAGRKECASRIEAARLAASEPAGTPKLDAIRTILLGVAKAEPVAFERAPQYEPSDRPSVRSLRSLLNRTAHPADVLDSWLPAFKERPQDGHDVLLREGYLYAETPHLARSLVERVSLEHVTSSPEVTVERGAATLHAVRDGKARRYTWVDGPAAGQRAVLVLFDRVVTSEAAAPLHRDLRELRARLGFDAARLELVAGGEWLMQLRYDRVEVPTLLRSEGAMLRPVCELPEESSVAELESLRSAALSREPYIGLLRGAIVQQVQEGLPFDEPKKEFGKQQDGKLREAWVRAWERGARSYRVNGDDYPVYDRLGRPAVPQVCLDFLVDTVERARGRWWTNKAEPRMHSDGAAAFDLGKKTNARSVDEFIRYAAKHPDWFDVRVAAAAEQIRFGHETAFLTYLADNAEEFRPGDMVIIRGYVPKPKDKKKIQHYHSFYIYESDPLTGMPMLIAGNAGQPRITPWLREMRRTPDRSIQVRIRPATGWLEQQLPAGLQVAPVAPVAVGGESG